MNSSVVHVTERLQLGKDLNDADDVLRLRWRPRACGGRAPPPQTIVMTICIETFTTLPYIYNLVHF